ncbi:hypothetical protein LSG31_00400 [Fodinisporobacter ferrooxydans]|uniref:F5/8 type C domain-containing protein n=1 Tax=Fodinisporobacter ferrooxydans TaxID=2901836 RepID=A0ABY4CJS9_9BACL|nr:hypothetical protein LSG31_00400 [Alicyclobacillaceae bacterium MYW30-H2]
MLIQPNNTSRQQPTTTGANGVSAWQGGNALPYLPNFAAKSSEPLFYMTAYPLEFTLFSKQTAVTTGQADPYSEINALGRNLHAVQVAVETGETMNATVLIEGTLDGVHWTQIEQITAPKISQYSGLYKSIRASITAYTSGTISVLAVSQRT